MQYNLINPFSGLRMGLKYEILDAECLLEIMESRQEIERKRTSCAVRRLDDLKELHSIESGSLGLNTITSVFTSNARQLKRVETLKAAMAEKEQIIEEYDSLLRLTALHMNQCTIPFFKQNKFLAYF